LTTGSCIVCGGAKIHYNFSVGSYRIEGCPACGLLRLVPQPSDAQLDEIYGAQYFLLGDATEAEDHVNQLKSATARGYLKRMASYAGRPLAGELLEIGCGRGEFLVQAAERGLAVSLPMSSSMSAIPGHSCAASTRCSRAAGWRSPSCPASIRSRRG